MEKKVIIQRIKRLSLKLINNFFAFFICFWLIIIVLRLHVIAPFFPILFLFDFCFLIGYPLFLRYVLKRKWFECTKDDYLCIRYIMLPLIIMELAVLLCYPHKTIMAIDFLAESDFLN
jgi:hypothetical protein